MKRLFFILLIFLTLPAFAQDYTTTQSFVVDVDTTATIITTGVYSSTLNASTGVLANGLSINYNITANESFQDLRLRAMVTDSTNAKQSAFYCTGSGAVTSQAMFLVFGSEDIRPTLAAINDCKQASSTAANNLDAIAYPGTVSINNSGTVSYQSNSGNGYFSCSLNAGSTNLNTVITTNPKSGTYSTSDSATPYKVEIYLDNIPD